MIAKKIFISLKGKTKLWNSGFLCGVDIMRESF